MNKITINWSFNIYGANNPPLMSCFSCLHTQQQWKDWTQLLGGERRQTPEIMKNKGKFNIPVDRQL